MRSEAQEFGLGKNREKSCFEFDSSVLIRLGKRLQRRITAWNGPRTRAGGLNGALAIERFELVPRLCWPGRTAPGKEMGCLRALSHSFCAGLVSPVLTRR